MHSGQYLQVPRRSTRVSCVHLTMYLGFAEGRALTRVARAAPTLKGYVSCTPTSLLCVERHKVLETPRYRAVRPGIRGRLYDNLIFW